MQAKPGKLMRWPFGGAGALRSSIPWITLSATVALTFAGWIGMERSRVDEVRAQFERHTQKAEVAMCAAFADPARRAAMERARDSGEATITGRLTLAGDAYRPAQAIQPGFVMYVPVYRGEAMPVSVDARAEALSGFVFAVFRAQDLMRGILDESSLQVLDMRVYDGVPDGAGTELMDTRAATRPAR